MQLNYKRHSSQRGFSLIELMIVIAIIGILVGIGIPAYQAITRSANEAATIKHLQTLDVAEKQYFNMHQNKTYATFDQLIADGELDNKSPFAGDNPVVDGYTFTIVITAKSSNQPAGYAINADPQKPDGLGATGKNHYFISSETSPNVKVNNSEKAKADDSPIS